MGLAAVVTVSDVGAGVETENELLLAVTFTVALSAIVAVSVSLPVPPVKSRLPNVASPAARYADVVPFSNPAWSDIATALPAIAASMPLSVSCTTGAGDIGSLETVLGG